MKLIQSASTALALSLMLASGMAAASDPKCSGTAIEVIVAGKTVPVTCLGYFDGNLNGNSTSWTSVRTDLAPWNVSVTGPAASSNMLSGLSNATTFDFSKTLYGDTVLGVHYGVIKVGSGKDAIKYNDVTAFYRFDAGTSGVLKIINNIDSISNATLYRSGVAAPVPEPETYAMLLAGLALVGVIARRRRSA
ncbi:PEP-CTERM sorting domain-containing protein [Duganella qianjiadongensis]|uniref:PEP-CTERM sorting domain-containing protein n=1 Tax=Duganella qianjiadongensis TaxID=2692176 RepID=UPI001E33BA99|nr:PEP-CTERM sorting domain-containing protein [Duganella qianjiadongensis]